MVQMWVTVSSSFRHAFSRNPEMRWGGNWKSLRGGFRVNVEEHIKFWLDSEEHDLDTTESLFAGRLPAGKKEVQTLYYSVSKCC